MNKLFLSLIVLFSLSNKSFSQVSEIASDSIATVKSPNAFAFQEVNFFEMNEYTGKAKIEVPIWEIKLGELSIPISVAYNTGGVKVNSVASDVGLNWSLNAGGVVTKEIKGHFDFMMKNSSPNPICGFLMVNQNNGNITDVDYQPDIYTATAPGISTVFTHKNDRSPMEITKKGSLITTSIANPNSFGLDQKMDIEDISIISNTGYRYDFFVRDSIWNDTDRIPDSWHGTTQEDLVNGYGIGNCLIYGGTDGDISTNNDGASNSDCHGQGYYNSYYLSQLTDQSTGNKVTFTYDKYFVDDYELRISTVPREGETDVRFRNEIDSWFNRIKTISYKNIFINFIYSSVNRIDVPGGNSKSLTAIEIRDNHGQLVKRANFVYDYTQSIENCSEPDCYRLRLKEVYFSYPSGLKDPSYVFEYNNTKLPKRFSYKKDFFGFYNGVNSVSAPIPKVYYYPNNGKYSLLPFKLGSNYYSPVNSFSLASNFLYSKAQSLSQIRFPVGGTLNLNYESHSFLMEGYHIEGGGVRIKNQIFKNENGGVVNQINYSYLNNGVTSGSIVSPPKFGVVKLKSLSSTTYYDPQTVTIQNAAERVGFELSYNNSSLEGITNNSYVGYNHVSIAQTGNGYKDLKFISPREIGNDHPSGLLYNNLVLDGYSYSGYEKKKWLEFKALNGEFPKIYVDQDLRRGSLVEEEIYDESNKLKKRKVFNYQYEQFQNENILIGDVLYYFSSLRERNWYDQTNISATLNLYPKRNLLISTLEETYEDNGVLTNSVNYTYDSSLPLIKEINSTIGSDNFLTKYYYSFDQSIASQPYMVNLVAQNRKTEIVQKENYKNNLLINTTHNSYGDFAGKYLIDEVYSSKGSNNLIKEISFDKRDENGNIMQYHKTGNIYNSIVWGYNSAYPIAKIMNAEYSEINTTLINALMDSSNEDDDTTIGLVGKEGDVRQYLDDLRNSLPNALVNSYTYNPLKGITSQIDPSGKVKYFKYDEKNQLSQVLDHNLSIESDIDYNYKISNNNIIEPNPPITSVNIIRSYNNSSGINYFEANFNGGIGPFSYNWSYVINGNVTSVGINSSEISLNLPFDENVLINVEITDPASTSSGNFNIVFNGCESFTVRSKNLGRGDLDTIRYTNCIDGTTSTLVSGQDVNICVLAGTQITGSIDPIYNSNCN